MSDEKDQQKPPPPPKPTPKTSTVPLKKETVRITLKAKPGVSIGETATVPPVAPMQRSIGHGGIASDEDKTATVPVEEGETATAPLPGAPPPPAAGAKTIPLAKAPPAPGAPRPPAGAKTIPLAKPPATAGTGARPPSGKATTPLKPSGAGAVKPLPRATVQLQKTQPMAGPPTASILKGPSPVASQVSTIGTSVSAVEEEEGETGIMPFAIIVLLLAIIVLVIELLTKLA